MMLGKARVAAASAVTLAALVFFAGFQTERPAAAEPEDRVPVILVVFDELPTVSLVKRPGVIDEQRFPNFSRLSRDATWYPNHTTSSDMTVRSIPSLLTGRRAIDGSPATAENYPDNLFALLRSAGYSQEILEFNSELCAQEFCPLPAGEIGAEQGFTDPIDFLGFKLPLRLDLVREDFAQWLGSRSFDSDFFFAHSFLPHMPHIYLPDGRRYRSGQMPLPAEGGLDEILDSQAAVGQAWQRQIIQVARVDRLLGMLRKRAVEAGIWDRAMVVITSDHGAGFRSGANRRTIVKENAASIAFTPLFIKYPGQTSGGPVPTRTQEVDVLPTIAEVTGIESYPGRDGMPISRIDDPWRPANVDGVEYGRGLLERLLKRDVRLKRRMLGTRGIWQMGPKPGLIGTRIPRSKLSAPASRSLRIDNRKEYIGLRRSSQWVPAFVYGRSARLKPGTLLAVGVNGRIAGTARVFDDGKVNRFGTVVDPRLFRRNNQVTVHLVRGGKPGRRVS